MPPPLPSRAHAIICLGWLCPVFFLAFFAQDILCVPSVAGVCPPNEYETFESQQVASDCLWSDPARDNQVRCELLFFDKGTTSVLLSPYSRL